jgi:hypothetical protein
MVDGAAAVGANLSMALDDAGTPVFAYYDADTLGLAIARCDDADCAAPVVTEALASLPGPIDTAVAFDGNAFDAVSGRQLAVVSLVDYSDPSFPTMRVVRCGDDACAASDTTTPDVVGGEFPLNTSIVVDSLGNPTISRFNSSSSQLTVVHCVDPLCTPHVKVLSAP